MKLLLVGCTYRDAKTDVRQKLAFGGRQTSTALETWRGRFPTTEMALLSTCNRVEFYSASSLSNDFPQQDELVDALIDFHDVSPKQFEGQISTLSDSAVVKHLYRVAASLDSMVVGEPQILAQVKKAYQQAQACGSTGPVLHELFQSAFRTAKRVTGETLLHKHRVSIPSVAISEFANRVFERFDDKYILVIGGGALAEETLQYLRKAGAKRIHVVNRDTNRGERLAEKWLGEFHPWSALYEQLVPADLVISTTSADQPVVLADQFGQRVAAARHQRPLLVLDLAVPLDFEPQIGDMLGVYLYSLDDLEQVCQRNLSARAQELPAAELIIQEEMSRFLADSNYRMTVPVIADFRRGLEEPKQEELDRLFAKLPELDPRSRDEIERFADRLVNKLLHPPLASLRDASQEGTHHGLLEALRRLFGLE